MPKKADSTAVVAVQSEPQRGMFDKEVTDLPLYRAIREYFENREAHKAYLKANKTIREAVRLMECKDNDRVLVQDGDGGAAVLLARHRSGGGYEIAEWSSVGVGSIRPVE